MSTVAVTPKPPLGRVFAALSLVATLASVVVYFVTVFAISPAVQRCGPGADTSPLLTMTLVSWVAWAVALTFAILAMARRSRSAGFVALIVAVVLGCIGPMGWYVILGVECFGTY